MKFGHFDIKYLKCYGCDYQDTNFNGLLNHLLNEHRQEEIEQCKKCEKSFRNKMELKNHFKSVHFSCFKCALCDFATSSDSELVTHVSETHNDQGNFSEGYLNTVKGKKVLEEGSEFFFSNFNRGKYFLQKPKLFPDALKNF